MTNSASTKPIANQVELQEACSFVNGELTRINPYLHRNKQQADIDFFVNAPVGVTTTYDAKLAWISAPMDAPLIKDQLAYIQHLAWQKRLGKFSTQLITQINKSIAIAAGTIVEALMAHAYTKVTGLPAEKLVKHLSSLKYASLISFDIETKARLVWDQRQTIHLHLRNDESKFHTQANIDSALAVVELVIDHWHNHFSLAKAGIHKKYK